MYDLLVETILCFLDTASLYNLDGSEIRLAGTVCSYGRCQHLMSWLIVITIF